MGWSCAALAGDVLRAWSNLCVGQTGSQNTYRTAHGEYFYDVSRTEHYDGAITGTVFKIVRTEPDSARCYSKRAGSFRIEADGSVTRGPAALKLAARAVDRNSPFRLLAVGSGGPA